MQQLRHLVMFAQVATSTADLCNVTHKHHKHGVCFETQSTQDKVVED